MKLRFFLIFCLLFISLMLITSCEYARIEFDEPDPTEEVSFTEDIIPIFNNKCNVTGCHTAGHFAVDLTPDNAYQSLNDKGLINTADPENSGLYLKLSTAGSTHEGRSTPTDQALILQWIQEGAKNN